MTNFVNGTPGLEGMKEEELIEISKTVPFHPGVDDLIWYLKNKGLKLAMVSFRPFDPFELGP